MLHEWTSSLTELAPTHGQELPIVRFGRIPPGSHIAVQRGPIYHHGIYVGDDRFVHFVGGKSGTAVLKNDADTDFLLENRTFFLIHYSDDNDVKRAATTHVANYLLSCLGDIPGLYDAFSNNCESFATFCRTGQPRYVTLDTDRFIRYQPPPHVPTFKEFPNYPDPNKRRK